MGFGIGKPMSILGLALAAPLLGAGPGQTAYSYTEQERQVRWDELHTTIFGDRPLRTDATAVTLDAPDTAQDAALVPIAITLAHPADVAGLYLVIDDNPSPVAAHFTFGPEADPSEIKLRVRINHVTAVHAVAEMKDGTLYQTARVVKASGGCSAPMGVSDEEAMRGMGTMRLLAAGAAAADRRVETTLMIRHPNFNGMQMNEALQVFTPARYIKDIEVAYAGKKVVRIDTDISLASNPVITFGLTPSVAKGDIDVAVGDSRGGRWTKTFPFPAVSN